MNDYRMIIIHTINIVAISVIIVLMSAFGHTIPYIYNVLLYDGLSKTSAIGILTSFTLIVLVVLVAAIFKIQSLTKMLKE
jgi:hypothetical protein